MRYKIKVSSIYHPGKRKDPQGNPHQEDSMFPIYGEAGEQDRLFILCDGMGGHEAGEVASATVCEAMSKSILASVPDSEGSFSEGIFDKALSDAYDALDAKDEGSCKREQSSSLVLPSAAEARQSQSTSAKKMGTTMTLLKLYSEGYFIAHIGDSRVYHIRPGKTAEDTQILFRTSDHSLVNALVKAGEITEEEALHHPKKNIILKAMQPRMDHRARADIYTDDNILPGDYFYLCSDGMLENMTDRQLCYFFSNEAGDDDNKRKLLLKATRENNDNHSAIIVHILGVEGAAVLKNTSKNEKDLEFGCGTPKRPAEDKLKARANESNQARLFCRVQPRLDKVNSGRGRGSLKSYLFTAVFLLVFAFIFWLILKPSPKHRQVPLRPNKIQSLSRPHQITNNGSKIEVVDTSATHKMRTDIRDAIAQHADSQRAKATHDTLDNVFDNKINIKTENPKVESKKLNGKSPDDTETEKASQTDNHDEQI